MILLLSSIGVALILSMLTASAIGAFGFAIATCRFSSIASKKELDLKLSKSAKYFIENSDIVGASISLTRRLLFGVSTLLLYLFVKGVFSIRYIELQDLEKAIIFAVSIVLTLFLQYCLFDLPLVKYAMQQPIKLLKTLSRPFWLVYILSRPFDIIARYFSKKIFSEKLFNGDADFDYIDVEVMLRAEEAQTDSISPYAGKILKNVLKLKHLDVSDVMLPRSQIVYIDLEEDLQENLEKIRKSGHTRFPLCKEDLDTCYGIIHLKDIFINQNENLDLMKIRRQTLKIKENTKIEEALTKMLKYKLHMALVEDEFGGIIGVLTLDATLSELVGQIRDEFDDSQDLSIKQISKNEFKISGLATLHRVEDVLGINFQTEEVSTFGGLITYTLGRFPEQGERIYLEEQNIKVYIDKIDEKMVGECTVILNQNEETDEEHKEVKNENEKRIKRILSRIYIQFGRNRGRKSK